MNNIIRNTKRNVYKYLLSVLFLLFLITIGVPTLALIKNRFGIDNTSTWNGQAANGFASGDGTNNNPYVISNSAEFLYFSQSLSNETYENDYVVLSNDIILNEGVFEYNEFNNITYSLDGTEYYVKPYTNEYYLDSLFETEIVGTINKIDPIDGFKGNLDGDLYTVYGLYITDNESPNIALFNDLEATIKNIYVDNAMLYADGIVGGIASSANNSVIENTTFSGYAISTANNKLTETTISVESIAFNNSGNNINVPITLNTDLSDTQIISTSITGTCLLTNSDNANTTISISNTPVDCSGFQIDLGNTVIDSVIISAISDSLSDSSVSFSDVKYNVTYKKSIAGGIIASGNNNTLTNVINKGNITGGDITGGIVGKTSLVTINHAYNIGTITSQNISGGLIGSINDNTNTINVTQVYNSGVASGLIYGGLIGLVSDNNNLINITNSFDASLTEYVIGTIENSSSLVDNEELSNIVIDTCYYIGTNDIQTGNTRNLFAQTTMENLVTQEYLETNIDFLEYEDSDLVNSHSENVWIFDNANLPVLFTDYVNTSVARIILNNYNWNSYNAELDNIYLNADADLTILQTRPLAIQNIYYLDSSVSLSKAQLLDNQNWTTYNTSINITTEGTHIVYLKITDIYGNTYYLNTDALIIDKTAPTISVGIGDNTWTTYNNSLDYLYINADVNVNITDYDALSGIVKTGYFISSDNLSTSELNNIADNLWINSTIPLRIDNTGNYIIYVKSVDKSNNISYVNSAFIVYSGYNNNSLNIGYNDSSYIENGNNITAKSSVKLNYTYTSETLPPANITHSVVSNIIFLVNTKIILKDNTNNKVYQKIVGDNDNRSYYDFTEFNEIGVFNGTKPFVESNYVSNNIVSENFDIIIDFSNAQITSNYLDTTIHIEVKDELSNIIRPTLQDTIKPFNIYYQVNYTSSDTTLTTSTDYNGNIIYNSNSITPITISNNILSKSINDNIIVDSRYETKKLGLEIKMIDSQNNVVDESYLKNISIMTNDETYYPEKDNKYHIFVSNSFSAGSTVVNVITTQNNSDLEPGTYYMVFTFYASINSKYPEIYGSDVTVPVVIQNDSVNIEYSFDVLNDDVILNKNNQTQEETYSVLQSGDFEQAKIMVSLYQKDSLSAFDQTYSSVDLADFVTNELVSSGISNKYYVSQNPVQYDGSANTYNNLSLTYLPELMDNTSYKLVFELYDNNILIGTIEKYFLVVRRGN